MKRISLCLFMICAFTALYAQNLTVKCVNLRPQDERAASKPRNDASGKKCAIIRVGVVGVNDLQFPDAVGDVEHTLSEYVVYVPEGQKVLHYNKAGKKFGVINFDDYGLEINSLASYDVIFESDNHLRSAIFTVQPKDARLVFDGKNVSVNENGIAMINMPVGDYSYQVTAEGYEKQDGIVSLKEDEISTVTNITLQEVLYPVTIHVMPEDATVFIDNIPYSKENRQDLKLSGGKHSIRVTAKNYEDDERIIEVKNTTLPPFYFALKENKQEVIKHKEERTRTRTSVRGAAYYTLSGELYDKMKYNGFDYGGKIGLHFLQPFAGILAFKLGVEGGIMHLNKDVKFDLNKNLNDSTSSSGLVEVPVQFGVGLPFGMYNRHYFSILAGGYYRWAWVRTNEIIGYDSENKEDKFAHEPVHDYGLRVSAMVDFSFIGVGAEYSRSLNNRGQYFGVKIAYKMRLGSTAKY